MRSLSRADPPTGVGVIGGIGGIGGISIIVPSLGQSPWQEEVLAALRRELVTRDAELLWVLQGEARSPHFVGRREHLVRLPQPVGFASAANVGLAAADPRSESVAIVNDDVVLEPGWLAALAGELTLRPRAAAVQGIQLELDRPGIVEGCGLGWNRSWQAVQVRAGESPPAPTAPPFEVFGVSATAALYRREALTEVATTGASFFAERLGSYYEDVELAVRLREAEWESWCVPAARARHAGQATTGRIPLRRWRWIYRNRLLVVRRLLGGQFAANLPRLALRDGKDLLLACGHLDGARAAGIVSGWSTAVPRLLDFAPPSAAARERALTAAERFRIGSTA